MQKQPKPTNQITDQLILRKVLNQLLDCLNKVPVDEELLPLMYGILSKIDAKTDGLVNLEDLATKGELDLLGSEIVMIRDDLLKMIDLDFCSELEQMENCINSLKSDERWNVIIEFNEFDVYRFTYQNSDLGFKHLFFAFAKRFLPTQIENAGYFISYMLKTKVDEKYKLFCFHSTKYQIFSSSPDIVFLPYNAFDAIKFYFCRY